MNDIALIIAQILVVKILVLLIGRTDIFTTRDLCININNHQQSSFYPLGNFLNPVLALLGQD